MNKFSIKKIGYKMNEFLLPLERFYQLEAEATDRVYLHQPVNGLWKTYTWGEVGLEARKLASAINRLNLPANSKIALLSKNCAHWLITDLAIWMSGNISIPLYPTLNGDTIQEIIEHSESKLLFVGKLDEWELQKGLVKNDIPLINFPFWDNEGCDSWDSFIAQVSPMKGNRAVKKSDIATYIYTSGTTGKCKGVVHTFESMAYPVIEAKEMMKINETDRFLSYLPLSHVAERLLVELGGLYSGGQIYFAESLSTFPQNLVYCSPTIFLGVPRIWSKFQMGILTKMPQNKLDFLFKIPILSSFIKSKIRKTLGLNNARMAITGAAPISKELLFWWDKLGISIQEVYGMTENFAYATINYPGKVKFGTIGQAWPKCEVRTSKSGEIETRSPANMVEYYKEPEKTAECLTSDNWIKTGDLGEFDKEGYLTITGRVKDLFKTAKGKYISPSHIEGFFEMNENVELVCVIGSGFPAPMALVTLSENGQKLSQDELVKEFTKFKEYVNSKIENFENIKKIIVVDDEWSVHTNILTPTLKIKRNIVESKYNSFENEWFGKSDEVLFY